MADGQWAKTGYVTAGWTADRGAEEPIGPGYNPIVSDSKPDLAREWLGPIGNMTGAMI